MICENCGMPTTPYKDGTCEFGDHSVKKMSKPLTIDEILDAHFEYGAFNPATKGDQFKRYQESYRAEAKAQIEAMITDIVEPNGYIGVDQLPDPMNIRYEVQRQVKERIVERATKYNLTLKDK